MKDRLTKISATTADVPPLTITTEDTTRYLDHLQRMLNYKPNIAYEIKGKSDSFKIVLNSTKENTQYDFFGENCFG